MKPIIGLVVIAVAGISLGTGFLNNDINLWIQQFGVGSGDIETPVDHVLVDFTMDTRGGEGTPIENVVDECILTPTTKVGQAIGTVLEEGVIVTKDSEMTCKITDRSGQIIREGTVTSPTVFQQDDPLCIPSPGLPPLIPPTICAGTFVPSGMFNAGVEVVIPINPAVNVFDIHDVIVVVHGNTYSMGDFPPVAP